MKTLIKYTAGCVLALSTVSAMALDFSVGLNGSYGDTPTFSESVSANGTSYGSQVFANTNKETGIEALMGTNMKGAGISYYGGIATRGSSYNAGLTASATSDIALRDTQATADQAVIDDPASTQTQIDVAEANLAVMNQEVANIQDAFRRSGSSNNLVLGATYTTQEVSYGVMPYVGVSVSKAIGSPAYMDDTVIPAVRYGLLVRKNLRLGGITNKYGTSVNASLSF